MSRRSRKEFLPGRRCTRGGEAEQSELDRQTRMALSGGSYPNGGPEAAITLIEVLAAGFCETA